MLLRSGYYLAVGVSFNCHTVLATFLSVVLCAVRSLGQIIACGSASFVSYANRRRQLDFRTCTFEPHAFDSDPQRFGKRERYFLRRVRKKDCELVPAFAIGVPQSRGVVSEHTMYAGQYDLVDYRLR